ncbi:ATP-binding protein [Halosimplex marinum]|uniref:receiver/sensor box histidine kinase n=1 Tax=Halosimplex marinum TaxID=3396620 RepID=UPI003F559612
MSDRATVLWVGDASAAGGSDADGPDSLERAGYAVVRSGAEAVADVLDTERPDCVVCDAAALSDAVEPVETVEGSARGPPVVVFAPDGDESLAHRTVAAGAAEYVPGSADRLVDAVERVLDCGRGLGPGTESGTGPESDGDRRARRRLEALFADTPDPVIEYEFADGEPVVESVNPAFVETFGYDPAVAVGEPLNDLVVPEGKEDEAASLDERVRAGDRLHVEIERETTDGTREFLFRNVPVEADDRAVGYAVYVDITDQKERERRLREQNDRLNEFASVIGHDLRNPMGAVRHRMEMARQTGEDRYLDDALDALDRMDELLGDLLRMARQGEELGETEPVSLAEVARTAWDHIATGESSLVVDDDPTVVADRGRLTQLLENLFINAVKHGVDGDGESVEVTVGTDGDGTVYVADDGCGIPASERANVFDSGFSTAVDGTGYGLAIVRQVARAHDWEAAVTESAEGGARFEFRGVESAE